MTNEQARLHIWENMIVHPITKCWIWIGSATKDGYGQIATDDIYEAFKIKGAHRLSKSVFHDWTPAGRHEQVRHQCHNRSCVNPDHMLIGTAAENQADRAEAGRTQRGEAHPKAKLSNADVRTIRSEGAKASIPALWLNDMGSADVMYRPLSAVGRGRSDEPVRSSEKARHGTAAGAESNFASV